MLAAMSSRRLGQRRRRINERGADVVSVRSTLDSTVGSLPMRDQTHTARGSGGGTPCNFLTALRCMTLSAARDVGNVFAMARSWEIEWFNVQPGSTPRVDVQAS